MSLIVITGGARCGKSKVAERLALACSQRTRRDVVVAVFGNPSGDDVEFAERIKHHRADRPHNFKTFEAFDIPDWLSMIDENDILLVDCLGTALSAMLARARENETSYDTIDGSGDNGIEEEFKAFIGRLIGRSGDTIIVTNEAGCGLVPEFESGRVYRDTICRANRVLVSAADAAFFCVCGRLIDLTELPQELDWLVD